MSEKSYKNKALDDKYQKARKRDKQEANAIIKRFLKYQDREKSSQSKRSLEIKNFKNLSISDSEHDENDENINVDDNKVEENVDEDNNSIRSACLSSSGDTVEWSSSDSLVHTAHTVPNVNIKTLVHEHSNLCSRNNNSTNKSKKIECATLDESIDAHILSDIKIEHKGKRRKLNDENYLVPIVFGEIFTKKGLANKFGKINKKKTRNPNKIFSEVKILFDSGASSSLVNKNKILGNSQSTEETSWETMAGTFKTQSKTSLDFSLPELNPTAVINTTVHITEDMSNYDMILGRDLLHKLGFILNFNNKTIEWGDTIIEIKEINRLRYIINVKLSSN